MLHRQTAVVAVMGALLVGLLVGALTVGGVWRPSHQAAAHATTGDGGMMGGAGGNGVGGMMGNGGLMGGMMGGSGSTPLVTSPSELHAAVARLAPDVRKDAARKTIQYTSSTVELIMVGTPPGRPGMYWQVDGLVNATVILPRGATVTLLVANGDEDASHGWELITSAPPYPDMPMMTSAEAAPGAFIMPVRHTDGDRWYGATITFHAPPSGTYYYLCPVPGHAAEGMWGKLIVQ